MSSIAPYGSWRSPVRPELLVTQAVGLSQVVVDGETVLWNEGRPSEAGRQVLMSTAAGRDPDELLAPPWSARSTVHEYGGLCYAARRARVVFCNAADQRMWVLPGGPGEPAALTSASEPARSVRFADPTIHPSGRWVVCVRERHVGAAVTNDLVAVPLPAAHELPSGDPPPPVVLAEGHDFFAAPRPSPDGARLAWLAWDHPDMPWDGTQLLTARWDESGGLTEVRRIAGGRGESISQPRWDPSGTLHYV
ncbi:MAG: S9 family peptidase, partial [Acidimicrobiales bacterium]